MTGIGSWRAFTCSMGAESRLALARFLACDIESAATLPILSFWPVERPSVFDRVREGSRPPKILKKLSADYLAECYQGPTNAPYRRQNIQALVDPLI
jgi:hypothetical protein